MSSYPSNPEALLAALAKAWDRGAAEHAVSLWQANVADHTGSLRCESSWIEFTSSFLTIRLRGMSEVPCLFLGGERDNARRLAGEFVLKAGIRDLLFFVLAVSDEIAAVAREAAAGKRGMVLAPATLASLLGGKEARKTLKSLVRKSVSSRSLVPYNYLLTPDPNMFFGREDHLKRLIDDSDTSFAIVGPGKIGKSSLMAEYRRRLIRSGDSRAQATFFVDFHECGKRDADSLAGFLARRIEGTSRSQGVAAADFFNMLRRVKHRNGGKRPELLLDEADEICHNDFLLKTLGEAAKLNLCRLVLCGRGSLMRVTQSPEGQLGGRLAPLRLDPLEAEPAEKFLVDPLEDLGLRIDDRAEFVRRAFELTGRLPHLLQVFGKHVAESGIASPAGLLGPAVFDQLRWDHELVQMMVGPLDRLDDLSRQVAVALLRNPPGKITYSTIQNFAAKEGVHLGHDDVREVANELFIHNVLAWANGSYRIAFEALPFYARETGLLDLTPAPS